MQPSPADIERQVRDALNEDIGIGDLTARLIPEQQRATARLVSRETAILCGRDWFESCFRLLDSATLITWHANEGDRLDAGQLVCEISGRARTLLTAERTAMNFLQTLSGVATQTNAFVASVKGTQAAILDTRKTIPGLRLAQKYAVTVGGGQNQRIGLFDGILIKENHIAAAGGIQQVLIAASHVPEHVPVQIEVESLTQLETALAAGAKLILLDNFNCDQMRQAVALNQGRALLEASGNISLSNVREVAETGVDRISIGSLTKNVRAIDLSMRINALD